MFKHLLVPLDGSALAESALPQALEIAKRFNGQVTLLCVVLPPTTLTDIEGAYFAELFSRFCEDLRHEAAVYLESKQAELQAEGHHVNGRILEGESVAEVILQTVDTLGFDAIVMSTHGRSGIKRWVYGSIADKVLRHAQVPVLLIRAQAAEEEPSISVPVIEDLEDIRSHELL